MTSFLIFLAIIAAIVLWAISIYNRLVNERNRVRNAFAQIDVQLTRRYDLIPNLVEAVKGYMKHERETLEAVINARNTAVSSLDAAKVAQAAHAAVKEGIGKPDMYITVGVTSGVVLVGGKPGKVLAHVDSIGGSFAGFVDKFCAALGEMGVAAG